MDRKHREQNRREMYVKIFFNTPDIRTVKEKPISRSV